MQGLAELTRLSLPGCDKYAPGDEGARGPFSAAEVSAALQRPPQLVHADLRLRHPLPLGSLSLPLMLHLTALQLSQDPSREPVQEGTLRAALARLPSLRLLDSREGVHKALAERMRASFPQLTFNKNVCLPDPGA